MFIFFDLKKTAFQHNTETLLFLALIIFELLKWKDTILKVVNNEGCVFWPKFFKFKFYTQIFDVFDGVIFVYSSNPIYWRCLFIMPLNLRGGKLKNTTIGGKLVTN